MEFIEAKEKRKFYKRKIVLIPIILILGFFLVTGAIYLIDSGSTNNNIINNPLSTNAQRHAVTNASNDENLYYDNQGNIRGLGNSTFIAGYFTWLGSGVSRVTMIWATDIDVKNTVNTSIVNASKEVYINTVGMSGTNVSATAWASYLNVTMWTNVLSGFVNLQTNVSNFNISAGTYTIVVNSTMASYVNNAQTNLQTNITNLNTSVTARLTNINNSATAWATYLNTTAGAYTLLVNNSITVLARYGYNMSTTGQWAYNQTLTSGWYDAGTNVVLATSTDRVGMGTTQTDSKLTVYGNMSVNASSSLTPFVVYNGTSGKVLFYVNGTNPGYIGIGTNIPVSLLQVNGSSGLTVSGMVGGTGTTGSVVASGSGSYAGGYLDRGLSTYSLGTIKSTGSGSFAQGYTSSTASGIFANISSTGLGSVAMGYVDTTTAISSSGNITSLGSGTFALGYAHGGMILSSGTGSFAVGNTYSSSSTSKIISSGAGSMAMGYSYGDETGSASILSSGSGSFAGGYAFSNVIWASGVNSFAYGTASGGAGSFAGGTGYNVALMGANVTGTGSFGWGAVNVMASNTFAIAGDLNVTKNMTVYGSRISGQIDWIYVPTSSVSGTTACDNLDSALLAITYTCQTCRQVDTATAKTCADTTVAKTCACKMN